MLIKLEVIGYGRVERQTYKKSRSEVDEAKKWKKTSVRPNRKLKLVVDEEGRNVIHVSMSGWSFEDGVPRVAVMGLGNLGVEPRKVAKLFFHVGINSLAGSLVEERSEACRKEVRKEQLGRFSGLVNDLSSRFPRAELVYLGTSRLRNVRDASVYPDPETTTELLKRRNSDISDFLTRVRKGQVKSAQFKYLNVLKGLSDSEIGKYGHVSFSALRRAVDCFSSYLYL